MERLLPKGNKNWHNNKEGGWIQVVLILLGLAATAGIGWWTGQELLDEVIKTGLAVAGFIIAIPCIIAGFFFSLAIAVSDWLINLAVTIPITDPNGWAYLFGWKLTRDLVNMVFIIVLVFIGLATILKIRNYEASKILPKLLIIALLINFSPVIVGFVIDIFDLITNAFLQNVTFVKDFSEPPKLIWENVLNLFGGLLNTDIEPGDFVARLFGLLVSFVYFLLGIFVFLLIAVLFLFRTLVFWVLFILAPIAFAAFILPATKRLWDMWLTQLMQWGMIGITISFFLYLSSRLLSVADQVFDPSGINDALNNASMQLPEGFVGVLTAALPYGVSLVFMMLGIMLGLQTGAMGAGKIIDFGKKGGMAAGSWTTKTGWSFAREKMPEGVRRRAGRMAIIPSSSWGQGVSGIKGRLMRTTAKTTVPFAMATRGMGRLITRTTTQSEEDLARKAGEEAKKHDVIYNMSSFRSTISTAVKRKILSTMIDTGQMGEALDKNAVGKPFTNEEILKVYENAQKRRDIDTAEKIEANFIGDSTLRDAFAKITDKTTLNLSPDNQTGAAQGRPSGLKKSDIEKGYSSFNEKIIAEAKKTEDIKNLQKGWWNNSELMGAAHKFWGGHQIGEAAKLFGRSFTDKLQDSAHNIDWYFEPDPRTGKIRNPSVPQFLASNAAQSLGMSPLKGGETTKDVERLMTTARTKAAPPPTPPPAPITSIQEEQMVANINRMEKRLKDLRKKAARTTAEETEIRRTEMAIENIKRRLGRI